MVCPGHAAYSSCAAHLSAVHGVLVGYVEVVPQEALLTCVTGVLEPLVKHLDRHMYVSRQLKQLKTKPPDLMVPEVPRYSGSCAAYTCRYIVLMQPAVTGGWSLPAGGCCTAQVQSQVLL